MADFDNPWKEALEHFFEPCMELLFPHVWAAVDWSQGYEMLDKELQQIAPDAEAGKLLVDKLIKVWLLDGQEHWLLIHIEIQTTPEPDFAKRMYVYNYRIFDRYNRDVVSLAILADDRPNWRPALFESTRLGCALVFRYPIVKLLDFAGRLEKHANPFALVVQAHLETQATRADPTQRLQSKIKLVRGLLDHGWDANRVFGLFRIVDWLMNLPELLGPLFWQEIREHKRETHMPFITTAERVGRDEGRQEGLVEGRITGLQDAVLFGLDLKFSVTGQEWETAVRQIRDLAQLHTLLEKIHKCNAFADVQHLLPK